MARHLGVSQATISRIEAGERLASMPEVLAWCDAAKVTGEVRERLLADVEGVYNEIETWRATLAGGDQLEARASGMESARTVRYFLTGSVPGLVQTAEYARRNIELGLIAHYRDVSAVVADRMQRQHLLYDKDRSLSFLMTETAIRWPMGPPEVMHEQWDRIIAVAGLSNVHIGIIPLDHQPAARETHDFGIFQTTDGPPYVSIELAHGMVTITDSTDVQAYETLWSRLSSSALFDADAAEFIRALIREQK